MLSVFGDIAQRAYASQQKIISIDNAVAKLHYRLTFWLLLACTCLVCSRQYIGEHIRCIVDDSVPTHVVSTFCFFTSTYTVAQNAPSNDFYRYNVSFAHPGVSPHTRGERTIRHAYYQWVPFVLFGQALLFYVPHLIWKSYENNTIRTMVDGVQRLYLRTPGDDDQLIDHFQVYSTRTTDEIVSTLHRRFQTVNRLRINRYWALMLIFSEILNLCNVTVQLYAMNRFLSDNFYSLGRRLLAGAPTDNPFDIVFPKVTKCDFYKYGPSGTVQVHDAMCVMALNIVNEKIYAVLWFWFTTILVPLTVAALAWRLFSYFMYPRSKRFNSYLLREITGVKLNPADVTVLTKLSTYSDWLLLYYLASNMDGRLFTELLHNLASDLNEYRLSPNLEDEEKPLKGA